ncbi:MAG: ATP-binding cassette domain-containing protein, partial [Anaerolineae bacterium]
MASVTYDHVTKRFGDVVAVNDLDIEIADKEFLVLLGPSGCGKTTALRLLAGLEELTAGNIYIGDRLVNDVPPKDRDIAMVFQSYALYPHMSVYDNMAFG